MKTGKEKSMTFDELAAAVVGLEKNDSAELQTIQATLSAMSASRELPESVRRLASQAEDIARRMRQGGDFDRSLTELGQTIAAMEKILENEAVIITEDAGRGGESGARLDLKPASEASASELEADSEILAEFISESLEHLQNAESLLLALESNPEDQESLNAVFRAFHSTKGTSSFLGLNAIKELAHHAEMLLDQARKGVIRLQGAYADLALASADMLKSMIQNLGPNTKADDLKRPAGFQELMEKLDQSRDVDAGASEPRPAPAVIENAPEAVLNSVPSSTAEPESKAPQESEASAEKRNETEAAVELNESAPRAAAANAVPAAANQTAATTVRVSTEKLDGLINMVGELVITQAMIAQSKELQGEQSRHLSQSVIQLTRITREIQDLSMSLRMVPLKPTFQKMERLVRDVARKAGKSVRFVVEGEETEIDRNMVESLGDPLVHMLRNAVDHGLESAGRRREMGKSEVGTVLLRAYHATGNVMLEIRDDGGGLNREKILAKAVDKGLAAADREMMDNDIYKLIFLPGFSTADRVTDVSGRGVGMDVVKKNIDALRGRIDISSVPGRETVFTLRIPLTLAIIDGMLIQVGRQQFILPTLNVQKAFRPEPEVLFTVKGKGEMVRLRDRLVPVYRLHRLFRIEDGREDPTQALLLEVEHEGETCALLADALLGQQQVVIKSLPAGLGETRGLSGSAILGDGRIGLILDVASVMDLALGRSAHAQELV